MYKTVNFQETSPITYTVEHLNLLQIYTKKKKLDILDIE